jgi:DNA polymerase III delta prime subunit
MSFDGRPKVIILDESDGLTVDAQDALRGIVEKYSNNCSFIFTANHKAKIIDAIQSRTSHVSFRLLAAEKPKIASQYFYKIKEILKAENIQYEDKVVLTIIEKYFPDFRRTINEIQSCCQNGKLDASILTDVQNLKDLMNHLKNKDFNSMRRWVVTNSDNDSDMIYRKLYDGLYDYFKPASIPQAVVILSKYLYQSAFVSIPEINLVACLTELMIDTEFK